LSLFVEVNNKVRVAGSSLAPKVDEVYFGDRLAEKVGAEALEFFDGVGGVEGAGGFGVAGAIGKLPGYEGGGGASGRVGGVDDGEWVADGIEGAMDGLFYEGVVGASEQKGLGRGGGGQGFGEVDLQDVVGDGMVGPAFFDKRDEKGAGLFAGFEAERVESVGVGVGLDRGGGGEDEDVVWAVGEA